MAKYSVKQELSLEDFQKMEEMEAAYYSQDYITPAEEAYQWHLHKPYTGVVLADGEVIVGFLDILPVGHDLFKSIVDGRFNDRDLRVENVLTKEQMLAEDHQPISLFVSCAVIHPNYRGKGVMAQLFMEYRKQLIRMINWGVVFHQVVGDCVTLEGEMFSQKIGMAFIVESDHGTKIFAGPFSLFDKQTSLLASTPR